MIIIDNKIFAEEGKVLTNGKNYGSKVYLGINGSINDWTEITKEEYLEIMEQKKKEREEKLKEANNI